MDALSPKDQADVEVAALNGQDQPALDLRGFRDQLRHVTLPRWPNTRLRSDVARLQNRIASRHLNDPFLALFNNPSTDKSIETHHFCEACTVFVPARGQDWQTHSKGVHLSQILSLCEEGELGHVPRGEA